MEAKIENGNRVEEFKACFLVSSQKEIYIHDLIVMWEILKAFRFPLTPPSRLLGKLLDRIWQASKQATHPLSEYMMCGIFDSIKYIRKTMKVHYLLPHSGEAKLFAIKLLSSWHVRAA